MSTEPLLIVGAGGFARETAAAVSAVNAVEPRWELLGFLDDDPQRQGTSVGRLPVLGPIAALDDHPDARVVVCIGNPRNYASRKHVVERLGPHRDRFTSVVHPSASIGDGTTIGMGTVVLAGAVTTTAVSIGEHVAVMPHCVFTHDDSIGSFATFGAGVRLAGAVTIGEGVYVGSAAVVREGITIGDWSLIGMGSLVLGDVPPAEVWVGSPAHRLRPATPAGSSTIAAAAVGSSTH